MVLTKNFLTKNRCYTNPTRIQVKKLVLHSLRVAQPCADGIIIRMNTPEAITSVHAFIEADRIIQTLPWDYKGWHVASGNKGSYNACAIGVEICEPKGHTYKGGTMVGYDADKNASYFGVVYENAVELFARLCYDFGLDPLNDILCHAEVHAIGYGSNHSDVMQWFPKHGKSMDTFRADVKARLVKNTIPDKEITPSSSKDDIKWAQEKLNKVLPSWMPKLTVDGSYGPKTRLAVLVYWDQLGWGKDMENDGTTIDRVNCEALAAGKIK